MVVRNSEMLGVRRKGTEAVSIKTPVASFMSSGSKPRSACLCPKGRRQALSGGTAGRAERGVGAGGRGLRYLRDLQHLGIESVEVQDELHSEADERQLDE